MKKIIINRTYLDDRTLGTLTVIETETGETLFQGVTLELPWRQNQSEESCIPEGTYTVKKRYSKRFGWHYILCDVEGRSLILIHWGNFKKNTTGCILVGLTFADIDGDGKMDITNSRIAMVKLLEIMPDEYEIEIRKAK